MGKGVTKTIENETREQKRGFLSMLLGTLGATLLGKLLTGKGSVRAGSGNNKGKGVVRAAYVLCPLLCKNNWNFNEALSCNKLWNAKILWKWTKI